MDKQNAITYHEYFIESASYKGAHDKWVPQAKIYPVEKGKPSLDFPLLTWQKEFNSQQQADDFAISSAQIFIDNKFY